MKRRMESLTVYTTEQGEIAIEQPRTDYDHPDIVLVSADQVETLVHWLQEARAALRQEQGMASSLAEQETTEAP
jgi:hypothetical protein